MRAFVTTVKCLLCAFALWAPAAAWALSGDRDQPIRIEADGLDIDDARGVSIYRGNVLYRQGSMELRADEVRVYRQAKGKGGSGVDKVVATGKPAAYKQRPDGEQEDTRAAGQQIEYYTTPERLILQGAARLWQGGDEFSSNRIEYEITNKLVKAAKGANGEERVQVTIQPRAKTSP